MPNRKSRRAAKDGNTIPVQGETQKPAARMPHERDESADSQAASEPTSRRMGSMGHDDLEQGRVDTDKGPVMDETYAKYRTGPGRKPRR